jgi:CO/xanthine dehydrogenase Mo-binding subunit
MPYIKPQEEYQSLFGQANTLVVARAPAKPPKPAPRQPGIATDYLQPYDDIFIAMLASGRVLAFNGHVDLGTGVRTALGQIVAEELYLRMDQVDVVLGHTSATPNQGPTIASATIQITAVPLRQAAAQARRFLLEKAARQWGVAVESLTVHEGVVRDPQGRSTSYWTMLDGPQVRLAHDPDAPLKPASSYTLVGRSRPRVDIEAKVTGQLTYVHDIRVPGMWHARVVRPPYVGRDCGGFVGNSLVSVDAESVRYISPDIQVITLGDFVAVAAPREEHAIRAAKALKITWRQPPDLIDLDDLDTALRCLPYQERVLVDQRAHDTGATPGTRLAHSYVWPFQMHASVGPSCSVADYQPGHVRVWSGSQNPHMLRVELSRLLRLDEGAIDVIRMEASGCYGRNCADDVCADAVLVSRAIGRPARVQLTREQEHGWEPKGAAQVIDVVGELDDEGGLYSYDFTTRYPSNDAPTLALLLTGATSAEPRILEMGDRTAVPPYDYPNQRIVCHDMAAVVRSAWLRGVSALPNSFAHDAFIDELAEAAGSDPVAFRLRHLQDPRARDVLQQTAQRAGWVAGHRGSRGQAGGDGLLHGRGVSYARYVHSRFPGFGASWNAWVVDVAVDPSTGKTTVERVVVGQDCGMIINPAGARHQIEGNVIQMLSRTLKEDVSFDARGVTDLEWGAYPIISFKEIPPIDIVLVERPSEPPLGSGESASVPAPAAIANALFDATGQRLRTAPFTPERVLRALGAGTAADTAIREAVPA